MADGTRLVLAGKTATALKAGIALVVVSAFVNFTTLALRPCVEIGEELWAALSLGCIIAAGAGMMLAGIAFGNAKSVSDEDGTASGLTDKESR